MIEIWDGTVYLDCNIGNLALVLSSVKTDHVKLVLRIDGADIIADVHGESSSHGLVAHI